MTEERERAICDAARKYWDEHPGGGPLHIVLDDGNVEAASIWWCIENSIKEEHDIEALAIAQALLTLKENRREDFYASDWEWCPRETDS